MAKEVWNMTKVTLNTDAERDEDMKRLELLNGEMFYGNGPVGVEVFDETPEGWPLAVDADGGTTTMVEHWFKTHPGIPSSNIEIDSNTYKGALDVRYVGHELRDGLNYVRYLATTLILNT